jgi:hypothetical protein
MGLPVLDKSWSFVTNVALKERDPASTGVAAQPSYGYILHTIKTQLLAWGWTVEMSCNKLTYGASDLWAAYTDIWWNTTGNPFSWIVLKKTDAAGVGKHLYLLLSCHDSSPYMLGGYASYSAFTGGSTTTRPTSTGEYLILRPSGGAAPQNTYGWWITQPSWFDPDWPSYPSRGPDAVLHAMRSSDGECERFVVLINNVTAAYIAFDRIKNPPTGMTHPLAITWTGDTFVDNGGVLQFLTMNRGGYMGTPTGTRPYTHFYHNGLWGDAYWGSEGHVATCLGERIPYANEIDGGYAMCPVSLVSNSPQLKGHHGFLYDIWWGSIEMRTGDTYPGDETAQFVKFTDVILPWDGSTPLTV